MVGLIPDEPLVLRREERQSLGVYLRVVGRLRHAARRRLPRLWPRCPAARHRLGDPDRRILLQVTLEDAARADEMFSILMGEDVEQRRIFIQRNAKDVRFLDI